MFLRCLRLILLAASLTPVVAAPLINEVMYRPGTGVPEPVLEEFIELHNPDAAAVDIGGWRLSTGVDFTFPAGSSIPGGGFLVVCANTAAFQARHPGVTGVLGNWSGTLANSGETITLVDALGVVVDEVDYADEGDWATRVREQSFGGWDWATAADGGDRSLELRQPALSNENGQNWSPSTPAAGTPGAANSTAAANIAPLIRDVQHSPGVPRSTDNIVIDCEIEDESPASLSVTLFWRISTASPPAFTATPMVGDADGEFTATLGPRPNGTIIEYYVSATDGVLTRTWPAPTDGPNASDRGQLANAQLQVDDEVPPPNEPFYRLVLTAAENSAFQNLADFNPGSNRQFNVTFIASTGGDPDLHHLSAIRIRGASSRSHNPTPLRVSIPRDNRWNGISSFNLNPKYSWLQYIGTKLFLAAGLPANNSIPVHLRRNGGNPARGDNYDFGRWAHIEDINSDYADNHFPLDPNGNLYKKVRPDVNWAYHNGNLGAYEGDGWSKETNSADDDWNDLDSFLGIMNANPGSPGYLPAIESAADVDQWMAWFALETIIANRETNASNGADDDYSLYRGEDDPRFRFLPHDLDTILGEGDTSSTPTHTLFDMTSSGDVLEPLVPFFEVPSIRQRYFQALRNLCQTTFAPARFNAFLDNHLGGWVPGGTLSNIKSWVAQRCSFIESTVAPELGPLPPPPEPTSLSSLTAPHGTVFLNEVLARNLTTISVGGTFPDVVELRNSGAVAADLSGMSLSDTSEIKDKFVFPPGTSITPGGFLLVYGGTGTGPELRLGFQLDAGGDQLFLYDSAANGQALIDSIIFGPQASDLSIGRSASQTTRWQLCQPTLGSANVLRNSGTPGALVINEWLANPRVRVKDDFIELYNPATAPVAIGGTSVTNDFANFPNLHRLPALSFVGPRDFAVLLPKGTDATPGKASELPFKFPAMSGWAAILGSNDVLIDLVDTDIQFPDVTRGRQPDGAATFAHFDVPTPGRPNLPPSAATLALLANLRITEIQYNPLDGNNFEFIELRNIGAAPLTLDGVRFTNGIDFVFPVGATLAPHSFTVLARDPASFESRYGTGLPVSGFFTGALDNSGETLALTLPAPNDVNILLFEFKDTWHPTTDGGGYSLELIDPSGVLPQDYDKKSSWGASGQLHGTPGTSGPPIITSPLAGSGIAGDPFVYQIAGTNSPSVFGALGLPGGLVVNPTSGLVSGAPAAAGQFAVVIQATNSGGTGAATLNLSIAASGPLHHFDWDPLNDQNANLGFGVRVTGRDAEGRMVTAFNGTGTITASQGAGTSSTLVVTEAYDQDPDQFEIQNVSGQSISTSGWFILINNAGQGTNDINTIVEPPLTQPELPATFAPGQVLRVTDDPGASLFFWGNVPWSSVNKRRGWAMIVNSVGTIVDFAIWGYPAADLNSMSVSANGFTLNPLASGAWSGGPVTHLDTPGAGLQRTGDEDHDTAADFAWLPSSLNAQNPSMTVPFSGSLPLPVVPGPISFVNGQAVAVVTISQPAAPVRLHLATAGHSAQSNSFTVASTLADSDGDGMPNTWESSNGLNPSLNDASGDLDADGQSNLGEFRAGTAANNPLSLLHLLTAETSSSGEITLTWAAVPGIAYRVTESETLGSWAEHPGARVLATGATASVTFDAPAGTPRRFFRIEILPAG